ncbi:unnamed protein product [Trifolium pratense]|uniref:Uncharacterized protein n=1 Tax=Trifolium pratense TaxID=57577 RepID=A0ACB0LX43_TRIPR|nr:unnamed protein product [Trifolium pratense]
MVSSVSASHLCISTIILQRITSEMDVPLESFLGFLMFFQVSISESALNSCEQLTCCAYRASEATYRITTID